MEFEDLEQNAKHNAISKYGEPPDDWYESVYSCYIGDKAVEAKGMLVETSNTQASTRKAMAHRGQDESTPKTSFSIM